MRPTRLGRHLNTNHPELVEKPKTYFAARLSSLKRMKLDTSGDFRRDSAGIMEASYKISLLIARGKKPHSICESLLKPCILSTAKLVFGEESAKKLSKISLSDSTVKLRIDELADVKIQVVEKVKHSPFLLSNVTRQRMYLNVLSYLLMYVSLKKKIWRKRCCLLPTRNIYKG